jgi:hypothetical protein
MGGTCMEGMGKESKILGWILNRKEHTGNVRIDWKEIVKWILKEQGVVVLTEFT